MRLIRSFIPGCLLICTIPTSYAIDTDWLEEQVGYEEKKVGARIETIESAPVNAEKRITVRIPKSAVKDKTAMEEIVVVGKKPDKSDYKINVRHEWAKDYDEDNYGLILYVGKDTKFPIRLYFDDPGQTSN